MMARRRITIDEKIQQQKHIISNIKDKYDAAVSQLEQLMKRRDELRNKELLDAFTSSDRSFEEIMTYLRGEFLLRSNA
ncbi:MAG: ErpK protein [Lachnospiraceae bacterium]